MPEFADAFFEKDRTEQNSYKGFTHRDDKFTVGGEAKITRPVGGDDDEPTGEPVIMKKKKFGGQARKRFAD